MVTVEFFGIPRQKAGTDRVAVGGGRLGEVLEELAARFPALAEGCILNGRLAQGYVANLGGHRFVTDPQTRLAADDCVLILSADAGG